MRLEIETPTGEARVIEYALGGAIGLVAACVAVIERGKTMTEPLAIFPLSRVIYAEVVDKED